MKFSILIAHYNNWNFFQECYHSILSQNFENYEIIIVDDCSTDYSYEQIVALSKVDSKIKLFRNSENKKVGFTKRRCVNEATGDICVFLDPDDMITSTSLDEIFEAFNKYPNVIATYSKIKLIDEYSNERGIFKFSKKIKNNQLNFFNINLEIAHLFSFKRDVYFKTEGIDEKLTSAVDQDLYLKLYEKGNFQFINKYQYLYRLHNKGVSQNKSKKIELSKNWHTVLYNTCKRRGVVELNGKNIESIEDLPKFIYQKENTFLKKLIRKFI